MRHISVPKRSALLTRQSGPTVYPNEVGTGFFWYDFIDASNYTVSGSNITDVVNQMSYASPFDSTLFDLADAGTGDEVTLDSTGGPNGTPCAVATGGKWLASGASGNGRQSGETIIALIHPTAFASGDRIISGANAGAPSIVQALDASHEELTLFNGTAQLTFEGLNTDAWNLLIAQFDVTTARVAIDTLTLTDLAGGTGSSSSNGVALFGGNASLTFEGKIAFAASWTSITDAEITQIVNGYLEPIYGPLV